MEERLAVTDRLPELEEEAVCVCVCVCGHLRCTPSMREPTFEVVVHYLGQGIPLDVVSHQTHLSKWTNQRP